VNRGEGRGTRGVDAQAASRRVGRGAREMGENIRIAIFLKPKNLSKLINFVEIYFYEI